MVIGVTGGVGSGKSTVLNFLRDGYRAQIQSGKYKMICCNDTCDCPDFEERKQKVLQAFDYLLPERSSYELPEGGQ